MNNVEIALKERAEQEHPNPEKEGVPNESYYTQLLKNGHCYNDINADISRTLADERDCEPKECYANCQRIVLDNLPFTYCEGFIYLPIFGTIINHAWLLNGESSVVDPTSALRDDFPDGREYFGVCVYKAALRDIVNYNDRFDSVLDGVLFPEWFQNLKKNQEKHGKDVIVFD